MIPKHVHLIWLGPDNPIAQRAYDQWCSLAPEYTVHVHSAATLLLPELRAAWDAVQEREPHVHLIRRSDLLRWSILLTQGGWYFDCDLRVSRPLEAIESDAQAQPHQLIIRSSGGQRSFYLSDAIGCRPGWAGGDTVLENLKQGRYYPPWEYGWAMEHRDLFAVLPPKSYSPVYGRPPVIQRNGLHDERSRPIRNSAGLSAREEGDQLENCCG